MPLPSGTRLGPYEILAPIGAGGMGEVYRAVDTRLNRTYVLRVLRPWRICAVSAKAGGPAPIRLTAITEAKAVFPKANTRSRFQNASEG